MTEVLAFLIALWHSLTGSLGGDAMALLVTVAFVAVMAALYLGVAAFRKTEFYKQHKTVLDLVDGRITDLIFLLEFGDVDLTAYDDKADERQKAGLEYVDPRMLYLLDQVQAWVKDRLGVTLDTDELLARAEHIFNEVANSDSNTVASSK